MTKEEILEQIRKDVQKRIEEFREDKYNTKEKRPDYFKGFEDALVQMRSLVNRPFLDE